MVGKFRGRCQLSQHAGPCGQCPDVDYVGNVPFLFRPKGFSICLPPLTEQRKIASILSAIDDKIDAEDTTRNSLEALFKTLLSLLMTGKIRVKDIEA
jgi:hypothetical protein